MISTLASFAFVTIGLTALGIGVVLATNDEDGAMVMIAVGAGMTAGGIQL